MRLTRYRLILLCLLLFPAAGTLHAQIAWGNAHPALPTLAEMAWERFMIKDDTLRHYYQLADHTLSLYATPEMKRIQQPELVLHSYEIWPFQMAVREMPRDSLYAILADPALRQEWLRNYAIRQSQQPGRLRPNGLRGMRIALDPGHTGGDMKMAELERKYIRMRKADVPGATKDIAFNEGNLALATACLLRQQLEAAGATVMMTREGYGQTVFGMGFGEWIGSPLRSLAVERYIREKGMDSLSAEKLRASRDSVTLFRGPFLHAEFYERARKINAFQPDVTLILHYNVEELNVSNRAGYFKPTAGNRCMAFVPGSYMAGELNRFDLRLDFLADLFNPDWEESVRLSSYFVQACDTILGVPVQPWNPAIGYLGNASLPTPAEGVFARNLTLSRLVNGPLCFGETLFQDNAEECLRLNDKSLTVCGVPAPPRVQQVARAYFEAVRAWAVSP